MAVPLMSVQSMFPKPAPLVASLVLARIMQRRLADVAQIIDLA